jgi:Mrp family chromosome partitioning ATPase
MKDNAWRTIAITSPTPAFGKTVVAINLAMSIAHNTDTTAMLVDFDFRRPSVSKYLGLPLGPSLNDVLSGDTEIADVLINPGLERMVVLPTSKPVAHSSEVLSSQKVRNMISELRDRYAERIVIFDLTPILGSDDAMTVLSQVDCALMVVGNGMVTKPELTESLRHIDSSKLVGTVLNKSDKKGQTDYYT